MVRLLSILAFKTSAEMREAICGRKILYVRDSEIHLETKRAFELMLEIRGKNLREALMIEKFDDVHIQVVSSGKQLCSCQLYPATINAQLPTRKPARSLHPRANICYHIHLFVPSSQVVCAAYNP